MSFSTLFLLAETAAAHEPPTSIPVSLALVAFLLAVNGFFVALEFALVGLRKTRVDEMVRQGLRGARSVATAKKHIDDYVAAAQLGITIASLALGMVAEETVIAILGPPAKDYFGVTLHAEGGLGFVISISVVTVLHVVIGEQVPKMLAINRPGRTALLSAPLAEVFYKVSWPFIWVLSGLTDMVLKVFGMSSDGGHHGGQIHSEDEIRALLALRQQAGLAEEAENQMIARVFDFFDLVATQIMIPRSKMACVPATATVRDVMNLAAKEGHDRYPVYGENVDEIVGLLLMKDMVSFLGENPDQLDQGITSLWRECLCVPGTLPMSKLMSEMREHHTRLAVVLDEYGGTAGMVTLGDVLERIVGEVDEDDELEEPEDLVELGDGRFSISGLLLTEDVEQRFETKIEDELNDTIGGVVFSHLGRKPEVGDEVEINGLMFRVEELDGARIARLTTWVVLDLEGEKDFDGKP